MSFDVAHFQSRSDDSTSLRASAKFRKQPEFSSSGKSQTGQPPFPTKPRQGIAWLEQLEFSQPLHAVKRDMLIEELRTLSRQVLRVVDDASGMIQDSRPLPLAELPFVAVRLERPHSSDD